ncbi:PPOX class F420-dependent oxidoreductase [Goodfellowiella coeruleoviolacea]|uniref:PPOX class probable F420-dependent enzyme n=1 Tax=Goodfellowiella coeruleoviolacea TaxID=334858 RepID=A0AAE3KDQ3_9PSEU|nr:PPOX class F420-dependent oxidoreductase [Goodfellowiella coeruleoviolacea]MCP2164331.1 PPOX class probable F420-dependent enzyme [Goodfellowiella coeruleoviolacea]
MTTSGVSRTRLHELLDSKVFATVATIQPDGRPQQSVVWVLRDGDDVLFTIGLGSRKERNLRRDPRVSVLVSPADAPYTYAAIYGTATLDTTAGQDLIDRLAIKYTGLTYAEHSERTPEAATDLTRIAAVRVTPTRIAGRL